MFTQLIKNFRSGKSMSIYQKTMEFSVVVVVALSNHDHVNFDLINL